MDCRNILSKKIVFIFALVLMLMLLTRICVAQTEDEMQVLSLFYKEKDLVVSPTRHPKSISYVAENMSVITAKEIEQMHAHTVAEVLDRIPGLFVDYMRDFGSASLLSIQGSEERHVFVLLDGIPLNLLSAGLAETNSIPVGIINRIEIIKGPASSAWGSSLGGVINIITKETGDSQRPEGSLRASYGERNSQDYMAELSGKKGALGYYLFAGHQESGGLRRSRGFDNNSVYGKAALALAKEVDMTVSMEYSESDVDFGDNSVQNISSKAIIRTFYFTASLDAAVTTALSLQLNFFAFKQNSHQINNILESGFTQSTELFLKNKFEEETIGANAKLVWEQSKHTAVLGVDFDRGSLDQRLKAGRLLQFQGAPALSSTHPDIDRWAVYLNDTIIINRWSITPGIRYDYNTITGSFTSPSLGVTYRIGTTTIARASISRGFTIPPLSVTAGGGLFLEPNSSLKPEKVLSYQVGMESSIFKYFWLKANLFRHDLKRALTRERFAAGPRTFNDVIINGSRSRREGFEFAVQTVPFFNLTFLGSAAYVHIKPPKETGSADIYSSNMGCIYDDKRFLRLQLSGNYTWWHLDSFFDAEYKDFVWDFDLAMKIYENKNITTELFLTAHNLFNGSQYTLGVNRNPRRWVEAGVSFHF
jgi:vitamin B12 transporter